MTKKNSLLYDRPPVRTMDLLESIHEAERLKHSKYKQEPYRKPMTGEQTDDQKETLTKLP